MKIKLWATKRSVNGLISISDNKNRCEVKQERRGDYVVSFFSDKERFGYFMDVVCNTDINYKVLA